MAVTWTISTLERNTDDGVVVAHWQASDSEVVGTGDDAVTHRQQLWHLRLYP